MDFSQKVALVTGAGFGIGRATAIAFAERGARVYAVDTDLSAAHETAATISGMGREARAAVLRANTASEVEKLVNMVVETYGALHYAVNNYGSDPEYGLLHEMDEERWKDVIDLTLTSIWLSMKYEIPTIKNSGGGAIVNIASGAGITSSPGLSAVGAAKAGVINLSKSAAAELAGDNIRVNAISPGGVLTESLVRLYDYEPDIASRMDDLHPIGRLAEPREIADCICFLCSDEASFMTGDNMVVDGGGSVIPGG